MMLGVNYPHSLKNGLFFFLSFFLLHRVKIRRSQTRSPPRGSSPSVGPRAVTTAEVDSRGTAPSHPLGHGTRSFAVAAAKWGQPRHGPTPSDPLQRNSFPRTPPWPWPAPGSPAPQPHSSAPPNSLHGPLRHALPSPLWSSHRRILFWSSFPNAPADSPSVGALEPLLLWKVANPPAAGAAARERLPSPAPRRGRRLAPHVFVPPAAVAPACALSRLALLAAAALTAMMNSRPSGGSRRRWACPGTIPTATAPIRTTGAGATAAALSRSSWSLEDILIEIDISRCPVTAGRAA
jgi:hypothetical protein